MSPFTRTILFVTGLAVWQPAGSAQQSDATERRRFLSRWLRAYADGSLDPDAISRATDHKQLYAILDQAKLARPTRQTTTHLSELRRQLHDTRPRPSPETTAIILALAGSGTHRSAFDVTAFRVRQLARRELEECDGPSYDQVALNALDEPDHGTVTAALHFLAAKQRTVLRAPIAKQLTHTDARIRLAAAEALGTLGTARSLPAIAAALRVEQHPTVTQALVHSTHTLLTQDGERLRHLDRTRAVRACLRTLGRHGWRADLTVVELIADHPSLESIDALISLLEFEQQQVDKLRATVAPDSPILRHRIWLVLRSLLGIDLPLHAPELWRKWWRKNQQGFVWQKRKILHTELAPGSANFYGIPVLGSRVAFVIDTSGSMRTQAQAKQSPVITGYATRLRVARSETLRAVQSLRHRSRFFLISFSDKARIWNDRSMSGSATTMERLTEALENLRPDGGTNFYDALITALGVRDDTLQGDRPLVDEIFFLSDGEPSVGITKPATLLAAIRSANRYRNVRINTIYTGDGKAPHLMRELAAQNGGLSLSR